MDRCPWCSSFTWHQRTITRKKETWECDICKNVREIEGNYPQIAYTIAAMIEDRIGSMLRLVQNTPWSKGIGVKDRKTLEKLKQELRSTLEVVSVFKEEDE
jgi:hypothetical protein